MWVRVPPTVFGDIMKIIVEEEYGYRYWLWELQASSFEGVQKYFNSVITPVENEYWYCSGTPKDHFTSGEWRQLTFPEYKDIVDSEEWDAHAHIHQNDDSEIGLKKEWMLQRTDDKNFNNGV